MAVYQADHVLMTKRQLKARAISFVFSVGSHVKMMRCVGFEKRAAEVKLLDDGHYNISSNIHSFSMTKYGMK